MMGTEDAQFPRLALAEMLGCQFHLARRNLWSAIEPDCRDAVSTIEKLGGLEMIEKFALPPAVDILQLINFVEQGDRFVMSQEKVFQVAALGGRWNDGAGGVTVARDDQNLAEIEGGDETLHALELFVKAIISQIAGDQNIIGAQRFELSPGLFQ
ncbi:MAG TPA: hypothetical protein VF043_11645 [Ktedonobacteraceae bacterium]